MFPHFSHIRPGDLQTHQCKRSKCNQTQNGNKPSFGLGEAFLNIPIECFLFQRNHLPFNIRNFLWLRILYNRSNNLCGKNHFLKLQSVKLFEPVTSIEKLSTITFLISMHCSSRFLKKKPFRWYSISTYLWTIRKPLHL